jgi:two-component system, OmpR family, response regulator
MARFTTSRAQPSETSVRILLIEDDPNLSLQVSNALKGADYLVEVALDGVNGLALGNSEEFDAIILDLGLPTMSGLEVLREWRADGRSVPVLILTARDLWSDKVAGMDAGADDYLVKPFHMAELLARVRALIRRTSRNDHPTLVSGSVKFDTRTGLVTYNESPVSLTNFEQRLLRYLINHAGQVVKHADIIKHIYAQDFERDSNTIEVLVRRLRLKLGADSIETVRGQGYRMK